MLFRLDSECASRSTFASGVASRISSSGVTLVRLRFHILRSAASNINPFHGTHASTVVLS